MISYSGNNTERGRLGFRVGSAQGWGRTPLVPEEAPHFTVNFKGSAKILKEVLSPAAGVISFIRIRALNNQILSRNGRILQRNSLTLQLAPGGT